MGNTPQQTIRADSEYIASLLARTQVQPEAGPQSIAAITDGIEQFIRRQDLQGQIDREIVRLYIEQVSNGTADATPKAGHSPQDAVIWTDGSCIGNPGKGGWAYVITGRNGSPIAQRSSSSKQTTNGRMELVAIAEALEDANGQYGAIEIRSDSKYIVDAFNKGWLSGWQRNGWRTAAKQAVKHQDLWQRILQAIASHGAEVKVAWVKAHAGHEGNELADRMANAAARNA